MADETTVGGQLARRRCFLCGARLWAPTERVLRLSPSSPPRRFRFACGSCGVLADAPEAGEAAAARDQERIAAVLSDRWLADVTLYGSAAEVREGLEAWYDAGVRTPILVPSSAQGGQMKAFEEVFAAFE